MLKKLYAFYDQKHWGYEKLFRAFQRRNLFCNVVAGTAVVTSTVAGGITLNPVVFASLTLCHKNAERANFARVEYKKILDAIRFHLLSELFNEKAFLDRRKMVDDFVSDHCMKIPEKVEAK